MNKSKWHLGRMIYGIPSIALRFADGGGADPGEGDGDPAGKEGDPTPKTYTQAELDDKISKAVADAVAKAKPPAKEPPKKDPEKKDPPKTDPKDEHPAAESEPDAKLQAATAKLVTASARAAALELGIPADRAAYAVRMADLTGVKIDDNGDPDGDAVKKAVEKVLTDIPELKGTAGFRVGAGTPAGKSGGKRVSYAEAIAAHYKK